MKIVKKVNELINKMRISNEVNKLINGNGVISNRVKSAKEIKTIYNLLKEQK